MKKRGALVIGIIIMVMGIIFIPISRIPEIKRAYTDQTQTVARSPCPPPILVYLETGNYHIEITKGNGVIWEVYGNPRVVVYDQNSIMIYQSSVDLSFSLHDFLVYNSGVHNITLEDVWGLNLEVTKTITISNDIVTYPFEWLLHIGLILAIIGASVMIIGSVTEKRKDSLPENRRMQHV